MDHTKIVFDHTNNSICCIRKMSNLRKKVLIIFLRVRKSIDSTKKFFHRIAKNYATVQEDACLLHPPDD